MSAKRVLPKEALELTQNQGYTIVDVRSVEEFVEGHPNGAYNIPFLLRGPMGMATNPEFEARFFATFPDKGAKVILSCASGPRSARAQAKLLSSGYLQILDMQAGFLGEPNDEGDIVVPGWRALGLAVEVGEAPVGRNYRDLGSLQSSQPRAEGEKPDGRGHGHAHGHAHGHEAAGVGGAGEFNRYADLTRRVHCVKLERELPGLKRRPYPGPFGDQLMKEVSAEAWGLWVEHSKMIINEYRMNPIDPKAQEMMLEQCRAYFYGEGVARPEGYVPEGEPGGARPGGSRSE